MPRRSRLVLPNTPMHIIQRGNNSQDCFFDDEDYASYLRWLREIANARNVSSMRTRYCRTMFIYC